MTDCRPTQADTVCVFVVSHQAERNRSISLSDDIA